ncbi:MAG TPA: hypothetical protein VF587_05115 [Solirubrobacteraceae bacterium]|jgi:tetratricopeptide (TPR) repeat protein
MADAHAVIMAVGFGEAAALIGALAALVALVNAIVSNRTAALSWRTALASAAASQLPAGPNVLLPSPTYFVNRDDALRTARTLIEEGEIVLGIEGAIGVGKSALATELAHRLRGSSDTAREPASLPQHSYLWIDCDNECPSLVAICRSLRDLTGDQILSAVAEDEKLDALRVHLAASKTVLVFDNLRLGNDSRSHALRALVRDLPAGSVAIASLNRPTGLPGARVHLDDLDVSHVQTIVSRAVRRWGLADAGEFDEAFAKRLRDLVGGNPRIVEWFLAALRDSGRSIDELFGAVARGEGLPEFYANVWDELSDEAQLVLGACSHLRRQAIQQQLAIACDLSDATVAGVLDELVRAGLVVTVRATGRPNLYTCSAGLQRFALSQTHETTLVAFIERLADHYIGHFGADWEDAPGAIPHMAAIQTVLEELCRTGDDARLQGLLRVTLDIYFTLGLFDDRIAAGHLAYTSAIDAGNYCAASLASAMIANTHAIRGEFDDARAALGHGLVAAEACGAPGEIARQKRCEAFLSYRSGDARDALRAIDGAEELARDAGDLNNVVDILDLRTAAHLYLGAVDEAERTATACLRVCEEIGWKRAVAYPLRYLAEIAIYRGQTTRATDLLDRARTVAATSEDRRQLARVTLTESRLYLLAGDTRAAARTAERAEAQALSLPLPPEAREARAIRRAARRGVLPPVRWYYRRRRPTRLTAAPVAGD